MFKTFIHYYRPYKKILTLLLLGALVRASLELLFPYIVKQFLEQRLPLTDLPQLWRWAGVLLALYLASFAIHFGVSYGGCVMSAAMEKDMRRDLFCHLQRLSFSFYDRSRSGQLLTRLTSDLSEVGELASRGPNDVVICTLSMLGTMVMLLWLNPFLGGVTAALLLLKTWHTLYMNKRMKRAFFANRTANGEMAAKANESISGVRLVKAFACEERELAGFMEKAEAYVRACRKSFKLRSYFMGSMLFFSNFINLVLLAAGGWLISRGLLTFGELVAFFLYVGMFMKPLMQLLGFSELYQRGMAGFKRFYETMQEQPEIVDAPDAQICGVSRGQIEFEHVSFSYQGKETVIDDFSLKINAGETVAFVGATGAGKTTIASLLLRFYEPQRGRILLDGMDIRRYTQSSLRRQFGLVQQDVFLFSNSVRQNIALGDATATDAQIEAAARSAAAEEFISRLPQGYATEVGERGVKLSGGQKQRLAIARVFLKNPPIVILDEATSALDNKTEKQIQRQLDALAAGRTTLIIAHRLSTVSRADKIVVLKEGRMVECGTQAELLAKRGAYYDLYHQ